MKLDVESLLSIVALVTFDMQPMTSYRMKAQLKNERLYRKH